MFPFLCYLYFVSPCTGMYVHCSPGLFAGPMLWLLKMHLIVPVVHLQQQHWVTVPTFHIGPNRWDPAWAVPCAADWPAAHTPFFPYCSQCTYTVSLGFLQVQHAAGLVLVDGWLQLRVPAVSAVLIKRLRQALEWVLLEGVAGAGGGGGQGGRRGVGGLLGREAQGVTAVLQQLLASEVK